MRSQMIKKFVLLASFYPHALRILIRVDDYHPFILPIESPSDSDVGYFRFADEVTFMAKTEKCTLRLFLCADTFIFAF